MNRFDALARVSDGTSAPLRDAAFNLWRGGPWFALFMGLYVLRLGQLALVVPVLAVGAAAKLSRRLGDGVRSPEPGVWLTSAGGVWWRWIRLGAPQAGLVLSLLAAMGLGWWNGWFWGVGYMLAVALAFAVQSVHVSWIARAWRTPEVELRIDEAGVYYPEIGGTLPWDDIAEILPRRRGDRDMLRLVVGPSAVPGLREACRKGRGEIAISLGSAGVDRKTVVATMIAARPSLDPAVNPRIVFVQPIEGVYVDEPPPENESSLTAIAAGVAVVASLPN
jgi:hypothetical protein